MATYTSISALKSAIRKKAQKAMNEIDRKGLEAAERNIGGFYTGTPQYYQRTGKLGKSPNSTGVMGSGSHTETEIYLDDSYTYQTGTWYAKQVMEAAENEALVGTGGFWQRTVEEMPEIIDSAMHNAGFENG